MNDDQPLNVLFLCTGNSARAIMAECLMNRLGRSRFRGFSAGSHPTGEVHPITIDLLRKLGYATGGLRSKSWDAFAGPDPSRLDFVITVCDNAANAACPVWPGQPISAHWGVPEPNDAAGTEAEIRLGFSEAYRMLENRISMLVNLPIRSLDKPSLQKRLDEIGKTFPESA